MAYDKPNFKLQPDSVRRRVSSIPGCLELPVLKDNREEQQSTKVNPGTTLVYLVGCHGEAGSGLFSSHDERKIADLARVTIYCDSGTIATGRVLNGTVRHTFRKNVTSLDVVERCLRQPAEITVIDWQLVDILDEEPTNDTITMNHPSKSIEKNLELIDIGKAILQGEREKLVQHIKSLEPSYEETNTSSISSKHQQDALSSSTSSKHNHLKDNPNNMTGMEFQFSLAAGPMKHVDTCLSDIQKMNKLVRHVATNGNGTVFLYGNGGVAYTPNIPKALYHRLSQLKNSKLHAHRPAYVSLGSKDRYFVAFNDGTFSYKGPKGLDRELRKLTTPPQSVAFGSTFDTFFLVFADGSWKCQGKGIPKDLEAKLSHKKSQQEQKQHHPRISARNYHFVQQQPDHRIELSCVNLGPSGEWFLRAKNGRVGWGGVSDEMEEAIEELEADGHFLTYLDFGEGGSYFISYD